MKVFSVQRLTKAAAVGSFCARLSLSLLFLCVSALVKGERAGLANKLPINESEKLPFPLFIRITVYVSKRERERGIRKSHLVGRRKGSKE